VGAAGLSIANLIAQFTEPNSSPVIAVGGAVIDATPTPLKEFAIRNFGTNDKPVLIAGILATPALLTMVIGILALRRFRWAQHRGIDKVEMSVDNRPWMPATLGSTPGIDTGRQWCGSAGRRRRDSIRSVLGPPTRPERCKPTSVNRPSRGVPPAFRKSSSTSADRPSFSGQNRSYKVREICSNPINC
jgi:hypothetical protein